MPEDTQLRVDHWLHQNQASASVVVALNQMLNDGECLDVINGELLIFDSQGGSQTALERFPDFQDLLQKKSTATALQLHLEGRPLPKYHAPEQRQAEQTFDAKQAIANSMLLTRVSAANV